MERMVEKEYMCKFCNKKFPSGKSLGGHIRIHTNQYSVSYNGKNPKNKKKRMVEHREITVLKQQQLCCRECGKVFDSLKDLWNHMDCCHCEGEKLVMDSQSDTETTSSRKRSKKQSSSESFSNGRSSSSSGSEIDQEHKNTALSLMMLSMDSRGLTFVVNSLVAEFADNNSETKLSSEEQLKMIFNHDNGAILSDSYSSDSDYFLNGPKKSDSDSSVDTRFNIFRNGDELGVNEGRSKYELRKSKRVVLPCYETDSSAVDTNIKIHRSSDIKSLMVSANKNSKGYECSICFKVFRSGQALGGHKRSHSIEHMIKHKEVTDMRIDLNLPAQGIDE